MYLPCCFLRKYWNSVSAQSHVLNFRLTNSTPTINDLPMFCILPLMNGKNDSAVLRCDVDLIIDLSANCFSTWLLIFRLQDSWYCFVCLRFLELFRALGLKPCTHNTSLHLKEVLWMGCYLAKSWCLWQIVIRNTRFKPLTGEVNTIHHPHHPNTAAYQVHSLTAAALPDARGSPSRTVCPSDTTKTDQEWPEEGVHLASKYPGS